MIKTDLCIIGSGPVALFAIFEAGLLNMHCHLIDDGQQKKEDLLDKQLSAILLERISVFKPGFTTGEWVKELIRNENGYYLLVTNKKTKIYCKSLVFSGGNSSAHFEEHIPTPGGWEYVLQNLLS